MFSAFAPVLSAVLLGAGIWFLYHGARFFVRTMRGWPEVRPDPAKLRRSNRVANLAAALLLASFVIAIADGDDRVVVMATVSYAFLGMVNVLAHKVVIRAESSNDGGE